MQGVVIDSANIITYNEQPYSFKPNTGSYVLAKDYKNNKFSITANYKDSILTSITVMNDNGETYVLQTGGSVSKKNDFLLLFENKNSSTHKSIKCILFMYI